MVAIGQHMARGLERRGPLRGGETFNTFHYLLHNFRGDVVLVVTGVGHLVEFIQYSANGVPFGMAAGDADSNGVHDTDDLTLLVDWIAAEVYDVRFDINADGVVDGDDYHLWPEVSMGRGVLSHVGNRSGYAGYMHAPELAGTFWHVRNRWLNSVKAIWLSMDPHPNPYVDGMNARQYVRGNPLVGVDPMGLSAVATGTCRLRGTAQPDSNDDPLPFSWPWEEYPITVDPDDQAAFFIFWDRCSRNDPYFQRALTYWSSWCGRDRTLIIEYEPLIGSAGLYCCGSNTIVLPIPGATCDAFAHELIHAGDRCRGGLKCGGENDCSFRNCHTVACAEIRAYSLAGQCCEAEDYDSCVSERARESVGRAGHCQGRDYVGENLARCLPSRDVACDNGDVPVWPSRIDWIWYSGATAASLPGSSQQGGNSGVSQE